MTASPGWATATQLYASSDELENRENAETGVAFVDLD